MADSKVLSVRISAKTEKRLARIAKSTRRSKSFLGAEAIEEFVAVQEWQIAGIHEALASLDRGEGVPHEDVKSWVESLGTSDPLPIPKAK